MESAGVHRVLRECENLKIQYQVKGTMRKIKKLIREKMEKVKAKEEDEVLQIVKKKKVQCFSINIGLNPGHHTTF